MEPEPTVKKSFTESRWIWAVVIILLLAEGVMVVRHELWLTRVPVDGAEGPAPTVDVSGVLERELNTSLVQAVMGADAQEWTQRYLDDNDVPDPAADTVWAALGAYAIETHNIGKKEARGVLAEDAAAEEAERARVRRQRAMGEILGSGLGLRFEQGLAPILGEQAPPALPEADADAPPADEAVQP